MRTPACLFAPPRKGKTEFLLEDLDESRQASGYAQWLMDMRPQDRAVLRAVVAQMPLYSEESRSQFSAAIGIKGEPLSARQVQVAVDRLLAEQMIYQSGRGRYEIEDHQLAEWLLTDAAGRNWTVVPSSGYRTMLKSSSPKSRPPHLSGRGMRRLP